MNRSKFLIFEIVLPLFLAGLIYLLFRPQETVIYQLFELIQLETIIISLRTATQSFEFPNWIIYSLPGGLWLLSFQNSIALIKKFSGKYVYHSIIAAAFTGIGLEFLQFSKVTDGRFDWTDLLLYSAATITSITTIAMIKNKWEFYKEEKSSHKLEGLLFIGFVVIIYLADVI